MSDKKTMMLDDLTVLREENDRLRLDLQYEREKTETRRMLDIATRAFIRAACAVESATKRIVDRLFPESEHRESADPATAAAHTDAAPPSEDASPPVISPSATSSAVVAEAVTGEVKESESKRRGHRLSISKPNTTPSRVRFSGGPTVPRFNVLVPAPISVARTDWSHRIIKRPICDIGGAGAWVEMATEVTNESAEAKVLGLTHEVDSVYRIMRGDVIMSTWATIGGELVRLPYPERGTSDAGLDWVSGWEGKWGAREMLERTHGIFSQRDHWRAVKACLAHRYVASVERDACVEAWDAHFENGAAVTQDANAKDDFVRCVLRGDLSYALHFSGEEIKFRWWPGEEIQTPEEFGEIVRQEIPLRSLLRSITERRIEKRPLTDNAAGWDVVSSVYSDKNAEDYLRGMKHEDNSLYRIMRGAASVSMWATIDGNGIARVPSLDGKCTADVVSLWMEATDAKSMIVYAGRVVSEAERWRVIKACLADGYVRTPQRDAYILQQDAFFETGAPITRIRDSDSVDFALVNASEGMISHALLFANDPPDGTWVNTTGGRGYWSVTKKAADATPARYVEIVRREITLPMFVRALVSRGNSV